MGSLKGVDLFDIAKKDFDASDETVFVTTMGGTLIFAIYESEGYEGYAFVLFERGGVLYEVNSSHCSCNGLSGSDGNGWAPEETSVEALVLRMERGSFGVDYDGQNTFRRELCQALMQFLN